MERRLAAILAADVVGYSRLMERDEAGTLAALKQRWAEVLQPILSRHLGRVVKLMGDGVLVEFASAVHAVACAVELQQAMGAANRNVPAERGIVLRIGINLGDVMVEGRDLYGDGVNIAARLQELAEPGGICVSSKVHDEVERKIDIEFRDSGGRKLKNIATPVRVYMVGGGSAPAPAGAPDRAMPEKPSLAVLPFDNLSGEAEQQYFSDGIAEDIIADLSKTPGLFVIARNSAFAYRGKAVMPSEACRELGVRYLLQGSVRKAGSRVRIAAQLIDGQTGGHLWAERYDRELSDVFAVQDEVTREIVTALALTLTAGDRRPSKRKGTDSLEAYDRYLRGRQLFWQRNATANDQARDLLESAIRIDPLFTDAYSALASVYILDQVNRWHDTPERSRRKARELAEQAVALDDNAPDAHWILGLTLMGQGELDGAIAEARKALALDPNHSWAHSLLGQALHYAGCSAEAIGPLTAAIGLDPLDQDPHLHFLAQAYFGLGRYEEAAASLRRRILRKPDTDLSRVLLAACYGHLGQAEEARALWREALAINPGYSFAYHRSTLPYRNPADAERIAEGLRKAGLQA